MQGVERVGFFESVASSVAVNMEGKQPEPVGVLYVPDKHIKTATGSNAEQYLPVEQLDMAAAWAQIVAGKWHGIGLLNTQDGWQHVWGKRVLLVEPGHDCQELRGQYPAAMVFTVDEFIDVIRQWPDNEAAVHAKKVFGGAIEEVS